MSLFRTSLAGATMGVVSVLALAGGAHAAGPDLDEQVGVEIQQHLESTSTDVGPVDIDVTPDLIAAAGSEDPDVIATYVLGQMFPESATSPSEARQDDLQTMAAGAIQYTADQNVTVPSIGIAWVAQDMTVNHNGSTITGVSLKGNSYQYGLSLGAWNPNYTEIDHYGSCLKTSMTGTFSAIIKGSALNFPATVLATDQLQGGSMVSVLYSDC